MMKKPIRDATQRFLNQARDLDRLAEEQDVFYFASSFATGVLISFMQGMWENLPDDDYFKVNLERRLLEVTEEMKQEFVQAKMRQS